MNDTAQEPRPRRLLDQVRDKLRTLHYSPRTEDAYIVPEREIEFFDTSAIRAASSVAAFLVFAAHYGEWEPHK